MKVGIVGASGYTGQELMRVLTHHPKVEIAYATSERFAGLPVEAVFPSFKKATDLRPCPMEHRWMSWRNASKRARGL